MDRDQAWTFSASTPRARPSASRPRRRSRHAWLRAEARRGRGDVGIVGLLHDFDFEMHPTAGEHPAKGAPILREHGVPEEIVHAVLCHAPYLDALASSAKTIWTAPSTPSTNSRLHHRRRPGPPQQEHPRGRSIAGKEEDEDKGFACTVNRDDITGGAEVLGVDLDEHIAFVIESPKPVAGDLGIAGTA